MGGMGARRVFVEDYCGDAEPFVQKVLTSGAPVFADPLIDDARHAIDDIAAGNALGGVGEVNRAPLARRLAPVVGW